MASEVEWRRKWKPGLTASPWQSLKLEDTTYLIKYCFSQDSYEILITDSTHFWFEGISDAALKKRVKVVKLLHIMLLICLSYRCILGLQSVTCTKSYSCKRDRKM